MTMPAQIDVIEGHVADALARDGQSVTGGLNSIRSPYVEPVILTNVPEESRAVTEETFGPTVTVTKVSDLAEAIRLANAGVTASARPCSPRARSGPSRRRGRCAPG